MRIPVIISERLYVPRIHQLSEMYEALREAFTYKDPTYYKLRSMGKWVGNRKPIIETWANIIHQEYDACLSLPRGGTKRLREIAERFDVELSFVDRRFSAAPIYGYYNDVELWPEQQQLIEVMFAKETCLIRAPTASGKTQASLKLAEWLLKEAGPVLIIVWEGSANSGLMKQWIDQISFRFGIPKTEVGIIGDGKKTVSPLTVGMQQTLNNCGRTFIHQFGSVICDEVQRFAAPTFMKVVDIFPARYRFGISADESRRDNLEFLIYDSFGEVAESIDKKCLIIRNKIIEPVFRVVPTNSEYTVKFGNESYSWKDLPSDEKNFNDLLEHLCWDEERNDLIWKFIEPCIKAKSTIVIATHRVKHALYWDKRIRDAGYTSGLLLGGKEYERQFETTSNSLRERKINVGVGTIQKIAQGHDIPALDRGFILTPLVGNRQLFEQMAGRFRRTCEGKKDAIVYYFFDEKVYPWDNKALARRYKGYVQEYHNGKFIDV